MEREMQLNSVKNWARKEVELAIAGEKNEETVKTYNAAVEAFCKFVDITGQLEHPGAAKTIFTQLLHEDPLTPIEADREEDWTPIEGFDPAVGNDNPGYTIYQCVRRGSLFKKVTYDRKTGEVDEVKYSDASRAVCFDIDTEEIYQGGLPMTVFDEIVPIEFPYSPIGKYRIFTEEFKVYKENEDNDTIGVLYIRDTDGRMKEVKRFFKIDHKTKEYVEIEINEYTSRRKRARGVKKGQKSKKG